MTNDERLRHSYIRAALTGLLSRGITAVDGRDVTAFAVEAGERCLREAGGEVPSTLAVRALREIRSMAHEMALRLPFGEDGRKIATHIAVIALNALDGKPWR